MSSSGILPIFINSTLDVKILLGKEYNGWSSFSGKSEHDESAVQTALREFNEETSYVFKDYLDQNYINNNTIDVLFTKTPSMKIFTLYIVDFSKIPSDILQECTLNFICSRNTCVKMCEKEKTAIEWFDINDIKHLHLRHCFHKDFKRIHKSINNSFKIK